MELRYTRGMLERAKACLKSGARDSLRCAHTTPRSNRMLHSAFWNHGAGDLDLPPWAVSMLPMPTDLPLKNGNTWQQHRAVSGEGEEVVKSDSTALSDGVVLDFLYPPQALAWMHRANGQAWERWERRNARRLPDGFVQTSRGYASRGYAQTARRTVDDPQDQEQGYKRGSASKRLGLSQGEADGFVSDAASDEKKAGELNGPQARSADPETELESTAGNDALDVTEDTLDNDFADSPGELAEPSSNLQRLRNIMASFPSNASRADSGKTQELSDRALSIYDSLDQGSKDDTRLKVELLEWLSAFGNNNAEVRCAMLYSSIPVDHRTLAVYKAALSGYINSNRFVQAMKLHREAMKNIPNGIQVTMMFFKYAVETRRWQMAMSIKAQYQHLMDSQDVNARRDMFWFQVSQIPGLLPKALALARWLRALDRAGSSNAKTRRFAASFFREALVQQFEADEGKAKSSTSLQGGSSLPQNSIGRLFHYLQELDDSAKVYDNLIWCMIKGNAPYKYSHVHRIVSYAYLEMYKNRDPNYRIPQHVLMRLLDHLTHVWDALDRQHGSHHSIRPEHIIRDWKRYYGKLSKEAVAHLISWHARNGRLGRFKVWHAYLKTHYDDYDSQRDLLWSSIYVHARRADLPKAKVAFAEAVKYTAEHGGSPPLVCWNVLLHAHARGDDLEGALDTLQALVDTGMKPDEYSFHPVMELLAKRGDVEGVKDLLVQYDSLALKKREAAFFGSLLNAHVSCGEIEEAEATLKTAIDKVKSGEVRGSLTGSFNIVLTAHALRRDVDATMRTYRWMQAEGIRVDGNTFAALIVGLTVYRQTPAAYKILRKVMPEHDCLPTAFHYALVMTGYVNSGQYAEALEVHEHMRVRNIRTSPSSSSIYLKAKALMEHKGSRNPKANTPLNTVFPPTLRESLAELQKILAASDGQELAAKQPQPGLGVQKSLEAVPAAYINFMIYIHGRRRCYDAVADLFSQFESSANKLDNAEGSSQAPIRLLAALMTAHLRAGDYDEVERCWMLAKEQADKIAGTVPVPQLRAGPAASTALGNTETDLLDLQPAVSADAQEAGFRIGDRDSNSTGASTTAKKVKPRQALLTDTSVAPKLPKPSPGRQHILTRPLRFYLYALAQQERMTDMMSLVSSLYHQGYTMDNRTWNTVIQILCRSSPPLALLAFTLAERFLTPHFPGWVSSSHGYTQNSARREGLQHIRARYLRPGQLMPQYQTLVLLGSVLLQLRSIEAGGRQGILKRAGFKGAERYVGTTRQIRKQAPKTLFVVQSMPKVDDFLQNRHLRRS